MPRRSSSAAPGGWWPWPTSAARPPTPSLDRSAAPGFASYARMLDDVACDAVVVCTPPATHPEICIHCLDRGAAVLCEKPLAIDSQSARRMFDAADRRRRLLDDGLEVPLRRGRGAGQGPGRLGDYRRRGVVREHVHGPRGHVRALELAAGRERRRRADRQRDALRRPDPLLLRPAGRPEGRRAQAAPRPGR